VGFTEQIKLIMYMYSRLLSASLSLSSASLYLPAPIR